MTDITDLVERLHAETPSWGQLPARMRFKQALVERVGVAAAFELGAPLLGVPGLDVLRCRAIRPIKDRAKEDGLPYRELWSGGTDHVLPMPRVIGPGNHRPMTVVDRAAYLTCLDDALVRGRSEVVLRGNEALMDFEGNEYTRVRSNPEFDPSILKATATEAWTMEPSGKVAYETEALMLCGVRAVDFGHWLVEYLPKLAMAWLAGWRGGMPVLIDRNTPASIRAALPLLLPADAPLREVPHLAPLRVGRLWCMANPAYHGFFPDDTGFTTSDIAHTAAAPSRMAVLMRELSRRADAATAAPTGKDRLFLARHPRRRKPLVNHAEIEQLLGRLGFHCVYPEDIELLEQLRLARHARFIVAPEGSNGLLTLFARAGARVCLLSPPATHQLTDFTATLAELEIDALVFTGPEAEDHPDHTRHELWSYWNAYRIDATAFDAFLDTWLA